MKITEKLHRQIGLQNAIFYLLFILIIGLLAYATKTWHFQADWTAGNRNSLAESTQQLLESLEQPPKFTAYVPDDPQLHAQISERMGKYQRFRNDIELEFVNPDLDPARAQKDGIHYTGQILISLGDNSEVSDELTEQAIVNVLQRLLRGQERMVIFLEGHNERNPLAQNSQGMSQLVDVLERGGFFVQPHNLVRTQSIPHNASFLVLASPKKALLPGEITILKQYIANGGNLLWLQDPRNPEDPEGLYGLEPLEEMLDISFIDATIVDANEELQVLLGINHPAVIPVIDYGHEQLAQGLEQHTTLFPFSRPIDDEREDGETNWQTSPLLTTLEQSWAETQVNNSDITFDPAQGDRRGPLNIGVSLTRDVEHKKGEDSENKENNTITPQQRIVVIGDSDFMLNAFIGQQSNLDLALNLFNWLSADDQLIVIKPQTAPDTQLKLSPWIAYSIAIFFFFLLPLSLVLAGIMIWRKRQKG